MRNFFKGLWKDESGAAGAEYALILALVGVGIASAAYFLGEDIVLAFDDACNALNTDLASGTAGTGGCA